MQPIRPRRLQTLHEELRVSLERARDVEGDLHAAEDSIHRLEADLRAKSARLEELAKTQDDSRGTVEQARRTLAERERLINRLETEAANSQALLGNIQESIKRLDPRRERHPRSRARGRGTAFHPHR